MQIVGARQAGKPSPSPCNKCDRDSWEADGVDKSNDRSLPTKDALYVSLAVCVSCLCGVLSGMFREARMTGRQTGGQT